MYKDGLRLPGTTGTTGTTRSVAPRDREDMIGEFVRNACLREPAGAVTTTALRAAYTLWCREHGTHPLGFTALSDRVLGLNGVGEDRTGASRGFVGINLDRAYAQEIPDAAKPKLRDFQAAMMLKHTPQPPAPGSRTP